MSRGLYELLALGARYVFAGLMALIVLRAWRITLVDSRRANTLRRMSPQTGLIGELVVIEGDGRARRGMRYPVIREGMIGSSGRADIRIRHGSVRRRHAYFQLVDGRLRVRTHAGAPMRDGDGAPARALALEDGAKLYIGGVRLLLVLTEAPEPAALRRRERLAGGIDGDPEAEPDPFEPAPDPDELFRTQPVLRRVPGDSGGDGEFDNPDGGDDFSDGEYDDPDGGDIFSDDEYDDPDGGDAWRDARPAARGRRRRRPWLWKRSRR